MSENDNTKTANEIGAAYALPFEPSEWLDKVSFIACEVEAAYMQGDCEFLAREGIADALESILCMTANQMANESQKCKADINYYSAFTGICAAFESCFCDWLNFVNVPEYANMINGIRADIKARSMRDFSDVRLESNDDFCIMPYAFFCYYPWAKNLDVEDFRIVGTAGQANIRKLIAMGRAMARAAQARKGAERIEAKGNAPSKKKGKLTRKEVAKIFGVSESTVKNWETGKHKPPTLMSGEHYSKEMRENRGWFYRFVEDYSRKLREEHKSVPNNKCSRLNAAIENKIARDKVWGGGDCKSDRRPNEYE